jgi:hypothetical protein
MTLDDSTARHLQQLAEAGTRLRRFERDINIGADVSGQIQEFDKRIEFLESRAGSGSLRARTNQS